MLIALFAAMILKARCALDILSPKLERIVGRLNDAFSAWMRLSISVSAEDSGFDNIVDLDLQWLTVAGSSSLFWTREAENGTIGRRREQLKRTTLRRTHTDTSQSHHLGGEPQDPY